MKRLRAVRWSTALILLAGLAVTLSIASWLQRANQTKIQQALQGAAEQTADAVVNRINLYQYGLRGARGAVLTSGESGISRDIFQRYSKSRDIDIEFPGARGFGFVRRVSLEQESIFLARARADISTSFSIRQLTPHDGDRYIIQYVEPVERNLAAIGLDIASETNRREAALAALKTGEVRLTAPITLVQASGKPLQSFLILMPIYRNAGTPDTEQERLRQGFGWSFAPLLTEEVLKGLRLNRQALHLRLRDVTSPQQEQVFYEAPSPESNPPAVNTLSVEREIFGRRWQIELDAYPTFIQGLHLTSPHLVYLLGGLLSLLLAALTEVVGVNRQRRRQIFTEQARQAAIVESSSDGIIGLTLDGTVTSWNKGAEGLFGYHADEAVGQTLLQLIVPPQLSDEEAQFLRQASAGQSVRDFETLRRCKSGQLIDVSASISPVRDEKGQVVGVSKTVHDISGRKANEAKILELNANLEHQVAERTAELRELNVLLSSVLDSASEVAIIATDTAGTIRIFNRGAENLLGYSAEEMIDRRTPAFFHYTDEIARRAEELSREYGVMISGFRVFVHKPELEGAEVRQWTYVRKDGRHIQVSLAVTAIRDEQNNINGYLGIAIDVTQQVALRQQVLAARDQLMMATEVAQLGIWTWSLTDNQLQWNERMYELYDQPLALRDEGLSYEHWRSRIHPEDVEPTEAKLQAAVMGDDHFDPVFRIVRSDGQVRYIQAGAQVEYNAEGKPLRVTGINLDITAQHELETHLRYAKDQADAANAAKSAFLANMSHEIRTPMNAVLGMLQLVQATHLNPRQLDYLRKAHSAAQSLLGLLNDILDYSKIEAGKLQLDPHPFELEPLMRDLAVILAGNQGKKDVEVMFDLDPNLPAALNGDSLRLQQVLINLAGNALKFTEQGQVVVSLRLLAQQQDRVQVRVAVSDTGIGISDQQLARIFEGFTQAEASTTRRFGGTGLGLVISKRLISLMGGELQVSSNLGEGSRFWFDIELEKASQCTLRTSCSATDSDLRILIADDNPVAGELLMQLASELGWRASYVSDGEQALRAVEEAARQGMPFHIVLMDWRMPDMDGVTTARQLSTRELEKPPLVVMITAHGREVMSDLQQEGQAPFAAFLTKPVTPKQLASAVQNALHGVQEVTPNRYLEQAERLSGLNLLVVEDNPLNRQVAQELLQGEGATVQLAEDGQAGVDAVLQADSPFDAVLMDIQMPGMDGLQATRILRGYPQFTELPIIAMTANASNSDRESCLEAGMNEHVGKPIDLEQLVNTLLHWTGLATADELEANVSPASSNTSESRDSVMKRFGGNLDLVLSVLDSFAPEMEKQLLLLDEQVAKRDLNGVLAGLHTLKGSAGTMGARGLSNEAGRLEQLFKQASDEERTALFDDPAWLAELGNLLATNSAELKEMFAEPQSHAANVSNSAGGDWQGGLQRLLALLASGNLQAIEVAQELQAAMPQPLQMAYSEALQAIEQLEFENAQRLLQTLLQGE